MRRSAHAPEVSNGASHAERPLWSRTSTAYAVQRRRRRVGVELDTAVSPHRREPGGSDSTAARSASSSRSLLATTRIIAASSPRKGRPWRPRSSTTGSRSCAGSAGAVRPSAQPAMRCGRAAVAASMRSPTPGPAPSAQATAPRRRRRSRQRRCPTGAGARSGGAPRSASPSGSRWPPNRRPTSASTSASSEASGPTTSDEGRSRATPTRSRTRRRDPAPSRHHPGRQRRPGGACAYPCHHRDARTWRSRFPARGRSQRSRSPAARDRRSGWRRADPAQPGPDGRAGTGPAPPPVE